MRVDYQWENGTRCMNNRGGESLFFMKYKCRSGAQEAFIVLDYGELHLMQNHYCL
ncbi:hypothetical protein ACP8HI_19050 [Paenibacillus sp. FA6]|uniref:hypothetical protein n=1 Tax=Paenibacillus sp. FA6 TaxID=3413029 RepID=UPI003F65BEE5